MPRTVTAIFVVACWFGLGAPFSHNLPVAGFAAKQAAIETGSAAPPAKILVKEWDVPTPDSHPHDPAVAPDGALWYSGQMSNTLGRLDPKTGKIQEFRLKTPDSGPHGRSAGSDLCLRLLADVIGRQHEPHLTTATFDPSLKSQGGSHHPNSVPAVWRWVEVRTRAAQR